ncbi:hypothetical protein KUV82_09245 [Qipengyuania flava]|nr:hypothetical protein KUV82_09245 [Qipengyuania flava]
MSEEIAPADAGAQTRTPLPAFTPVPRQKDRSNGWKPQVQRAFIEALADTGSVTAACRAVRRSTHGAYHLRRQPGAEEFAAAWEAAVDLGMRRIEDTAMDRALNGVEVPVYSYGKLVGTRTVHNDRLLMFMLRNRAPERFAEGRAKGLNAVGKMEAERLKKQWRKEWEEEQRRAAWQTPEEEEAVITALNEKLQKMHDRSMSAMSPRTRAAYDEFRRLEAEDEAQGYSRWDDPEHPDYIDPAKRLAATQPPAPTLPPPGWRKGGSDTEPEGEEENPRWRTLKDEGWE